MWLGWLLTTVVAGTWPLPATDGAGPAIGWEAASLPAGGAKGFVELDNGEILATRTVRDSEGVRVACSRSVDGGRRWGPAVTIVADPDPKADLGDGHLLQLQSGEVLYSYRHNRYRGAAGQQATYSIRVAQSADRGGAWRAHSTVAHSQSPEHGRPTRGLWASFLLQLPDGSIQCYYDDEDTPHLRGFAGHQWTTMRVWSAAAGAWESPVTVSRAHDARHLSRDGMPSVVALGALHLICVVESCDVRPPHANWIRMVESRDGGRTWSWTTRERAAVYAPANNFLAVSPWLARLRNGTLACVFATDEDRPAPGKPGSPVWRLRLDIKCVTSSDGARNWTPRPTVVDNATHRGYIPGIVELTRRADFEPILVLYHDAETGFRAKRGRLTEAPPP